MDKGSADCEPPGRSGSAAAQAAGCCPRGGCDCALMVELVDPRHLLSPAQAGFIRQSLAAAAAYLELTGELRVRVVDDAEMSAAHQRYSGISGTTDVLTFDLRGEREKAEAPRGMDVDVLVCVDEARRASGLRGHPPEHELLLYCLHGLLHCAGYDDHDDASYAAMHAMEDRVLAAIGVGPVFARRAGSGEAQA